jgi:hypothetical protein
MRFSRAWPLAAVLAAAAPAARAYQVTPRPKKGVPYPGSPQTIPYEEVLDHCDLVLAGKVTALRFDQIEVRVGEVLRGRFKPAKVTIAFKGQWRGDPTEKPKVGESAVFLCLVGEKGALRLAGDPPKGGGFVQEGAEFTKKLLKAAKDPKKGYESDDFNVRLSSAYRLAQAWLKAEKGKKPKPPPGLMDTFCGGLVPGEFCRRHTNAAARNCINQLLGCDVFRIAKYSVNRPEDKRTAAADRVDKIWLQTAKAVRHRRAKRAEAASADRAEVRKLIARLGAGDGDAAGKARARLLELGRAALDEVRAAASGEDAKRAAACKSLAKEIEKAISKEMDIFGYTFDLDRAEPFVADREEDPGELE